MTVRISPCAPNRETRNAELLRDALLASEPELNHPDVKAEILCGLHLPDREIDLVLIYHDPRSTELQLKTTDGHPIHSFVLIVEVKKHSPDLVRFSGPKVIVRYGARESDATDQCNAQIYALRNYQGAPYQGTNRRAPTWIHSAIWLARAPRSAFDGTPAQSSIPVHFADVRWIDIVDSLQLLNGEVRGLQDRPDHPRYHSFETLRGQLAYEVRPTRLDLRRVNALTQTRFDAEKTAYIQNLGNGLLILRGRGGTGKTFALLQIALHLARQGRRTAVLTYNHGLIADINRALRFIEDREPSLNPLPVCQTRYSFIQDIFVGEFGLPEERKVRDEPKIVRREEIRLAKLTCNGGRLHCDFDFILVDEGQDWTEEQRDFLYGLCGPEQVIVADGVDQFVDQSRCKWDRDGIRINRRHGLRASRRTKGATCQTISDIARELGLSDWDLEPDPDAHGGRFTVVVEPEARLAVAKGLEIVDADQRQEPTLRSVDNLICLPSGKMAKGINYPVLFDRAVAAASRDSWRGFDEKDRRYYPVREGQLRAVQYQSCRGMEGWTTICLGLDLFFQFQLDNPVIDEEMFKKDIENRHGLFLNKSEEIGERQRAARQFAINWLMIPLTRSIDHLVIHITDVQSELGQLLSRVSKRSPGAIEWIMPADPPD